MIIQIIHNQSLGTNELVGTWKINFKDFQDDQLAARWVNIYGPSLFAKSSHQKEMMTLFGYDIGSHYRGRLLYSIGSYDQEGAKSSVTNLKFSFPENPEPTSQQKTYLLRIDVLEATELPQRKNAIFHFQIGPYLLRTKPDILHPVINLDFLFQLGIYLC